MADDHMLRDTLSRIHRGGDVRYHQKNEAAGKLFCRERITRLVDPDSFVEDGALANCHAYELPADGVIIGVAKVDGRPVAIMANDATVKAGSWGKKTVEKIIRIQETACRLQVPLIYLVDSAGARIPDQLEMFPGRLGAGRIFYNQVQMSGVVPQVCLLFGPSAAGGAYIPAFCDVVGMVKGNASMYLGSPRMAESVIGEKVTLEEMGGAQMHCSVSGCGDVLCSTEDEAIAFCKRYLAYMPSHWQQSPPRVFSRPPSPTARPIAEIIPSDEQKPFDVQQVIEALVDEGSWLEIKSLYARELLTGFARMDGQVIGIVANQSKWLGGVLFVESANKAARFIELCDAFNIPLLYLVDVPGFMIGTKVEKQGIIRAGAKMIAAVSEATVPKISVILRKAYGAGLYAMGGPAFAPDVVLALSTASIAVMGPQAAVNAVYYHQIRQIQPGPERDQLVFELQQQYRADIDIFRVASELVVDALVAADCLRKEIVSRFSYLTNKQEPRPLKKHRITPL
ncbi:acyl-CoA carboxylase subunit beta [Pajaroellobacter abortibovis]|uniref:Carboxylase n=1 Tax=Pajaroellobacter abortibovis TaxID=1882918 RepID=A0A1L6MZG7_9BACT|nr:acyl-CoA carboxylase subunit beta [Pajaroellobacter abortibovis]APS00964.1 carboxylase [Pajaroellobacter abortibovis]